MRPPSHVVLDGVAQQVGQDLLDARFVAQHAPGPAVDVLLDAQAALFGGRLDHRQRRIDQWRQLQRHRPQIEHARFDARQVERVVDHVQQVPAGLLDLRGPAALVLGQGGPAVQPEQLRKAEHRVQRCAQFMAHARDELALGAVGGLGLLARPLGFGQPQVFADVLDHADGAFRLAGRIAQQGHGQLHRHGRTVLRQVALLAPVDLAVATLHRRHQLGVFQPVVGVCELAHAIVPSVRPGCNPAAGCRRGLALRMRPFMSVLTMPTARGVQDGLQLLLAAAQRLGGAPALADLVAQRAGARVHRAFDAPCAAGDQSAATHPAATRPSAPAPRTARRSRARASATCRGAASSRSNQSRPAKAQRAVAG